MATRSTPRARSTGPGRSVRPTASSMRSTGGTDASVPRSRFTSRAIVLLVILLALGMSYAASVRAWLNQRSDTNMLCTQIAERQARVDALTHQHLRLSDPAYVRMLAAQKFGWVMPGENSYTVLGADGKPIPDGVNELTQPATVLAKGTPEWWENGWSSVVESGKTPQQVMHEEQVRRAPVRQPAAKIGPEQGGKHGG